MSIQLLLRLMKSLTALGFYHCRLQLPLVHLQSPALLDVVMGLRLMNALSSSQLRSHGYHGLQLSLMYPRPLECFMGITSCSFVGCMQS